MFNSMSAVINSNEIDSIGGFVVPVCTHKGVLQFGTYVSLFRKPLEDYELQEITEEWSTLPFGNETSGAFSVNFGEINQRNFAIHIEQGKIGIIFTFSNSLLLDAEVINKMDEIDFTAELKTRFNENATLGFSLAHTSAKFFQKAEGLMQKNSYSEALALFNKGIEISSKTWKGAPWNPTSKYNSLKACADNEGLPLKIPIEEVSNLKLAFFMRGYCKFSTNDFLGALQDFRESQTLDENFFNSTFWRAHTEYQLGDIAAAIETMKSCCDKHPRCDSFLFCGHLLTIHGRYTEANNYLQKAHQLLSLDTRVQ